MGSIIQIAWKLRSVQRNNVHYTGDYKWGIIKELEDKHFSLHQVSAKYNISPSVISKWRRDYKQFGISSLYEEKPQGRPPKMKDPKKSPVKKNTPSDPYQELLDENLRLRIENAYLKKIQTLTLKDSGRKPSKS